MQYDLNYFFTALYFNSGVRRKSINSSFNCLYASRGWNGQRFSTSVVLSDRRPLFAKHVPFNSQKKKKMIFSTWHVYDRDKRTCPESKLGGRIQKMNYKSTLLYIYITFCGHIYEQALLTWINNKTQIN